MKYLDLICLCAAVLVASIFVVELGIIGPSLMHALGFTRMQASQMLTFYLVGISCSFLPIGFFTDKLGAKTIFLGSLLIFAFGSLLIALSDRFGLMVALHAFLGVGAGMLLNATLTSIKQNFEDASRTAAYAYWAGCAGIGVILGPIVGQQLLAHFSWPAVYYFNTLCFLILVVLCACFMPKSIALNQNKLFSSKFFKTLCYSLWSLLLFILLNQLANAYLNYEIAALVALTVTLLFWASRSPTIKSMINFHYCFGAFMCMMVYFVFYSWLQSAPLWLHSHTSWSNINIAHALLPFTIMFAATPFFIAKFAHKLKNKTLLIAAVSSFVVAYLLWTLAAHLGIHSLSLVAFGIVGLGCGLGNTPAAMTTMAGIKNHDSDGIQLGTLSSLRWLGGASGSTIASYLFIHFQGALIINTTVIIALGVLSLLLVRRLKTL